MDDRARPGGEASRQNETLTQILSELDAGTSKGFQERLYPIVYEELRDLASRLMRSERSGHTLQPTALVHETYLKLVTGRTPQAWTGRAHFFGVAARAMRQVLIEHARKRTAQKRGLGRDHVTLDESLLPGSAPEVQILKLDSLLEQLQELDSRMSQIVELRVFGGLTVAEVAEFLDVSLRTVDRDWGVAKLWFIQQLGAES